MRSTPCQLSLALPCFAAAGHQATIVETAQPGVDVPLYFISRHPSKPPLSLRPAVQLPGPQQSKLLPLLPSPHCTLNIFVSSHVQLAATDKKRSALCCSQEGIHGLSPARPPTVSPVEDCTARTSRRRRPTAVGRPLHEQMLRATASKTRTPLGLKRPGNC